MNMGRRYCLILALLMIGLGHCVAQDASIAEKAIVSVGVDVVPAVKALVKGTVTEQFIGDDQLPPEDVTPTIGKSAQICDCCPKPRDCNDIQYQTSVSGVYTIYVGHMQRPVLVYCDMTTDGGGWTVFQRRRDGSLNFYRSWNWYRYGFGNPAAEFWLGLRNVHAVTSNGNRYVLRVDTRDVFGISRYAVYDNFKIGPINSYYALSSIGAYSGNAGDALTYHLGRGFSTFDEDHDAYIGSCASLFKGGWWYNLCYKSHLNGPYFGGPFGYGVHWDGLPLMLKFSEMKFRRADPDF